MYIIMINQILNFLPSFVHNEDLSIELNKERLIKYIKRNNYVYANEIDKNLIINKINYPLYDIFLVQAKFIV
jgi:hypothetical protein